MNFAIVEELSLDLIELANVFAGISDHVNDNLKDSGYGPGVSSIIFGVNCIDPKLLVPSRDFETGFVLYKKYTKASRQLDVKIKLNHKELSDATEMDVAKILVRGFFNSRLSVVELNIKDFAADAFYEDVISVLSNYLPAEESYQEKIFHYQHRQALKFEANEKMLREEFWRLVHSSRSETNNSLDKQIEILTTKLGALTESEIVGFECMLRELLVEANHYNVMAIQKMAEGWVTDDSFLYFRCKIILQGQAIFQNAIENPDLVVERMDASQSGELLLYVADTAFANKFGESTEKVFPREYASKIIDYNSDDFPIGGEDWNEEDLPKRFPALWKAYH
ncbi:DUF4240 domain-containing protein [Chryseolinea lacunae]|uniref:DUF4240 domain-containing protein n=1 Tax=Chryseolinea lacunae TaxID=2801331 RepID=A0ABS1L057_9BACT|nr:DUF4240 domain-containing protein [Chryseolinea lacunae]MBL0745091.1 DUF4240 domain-containing protein [Chryseolinea lacunae]